MQMSKIQTYTHRKTFCFSKQQIDVFNMLEKYNVNVSAFVRAAIKEKLQRDWKTIKEEKQRNRCPF